MEGTVLEAVFNVFFEVGDWIVRAVNNFIPMFYVDGALTFLGVLAVAGLAISVVFLLIGIIQRFLHFGG